MILNPLFSKALAHQKILLIPNHPVFSQYYAPFDYVYEFEAYTPASIGVGIQKMSGLILSCSVSVLEQRRKALLEAFDDSVARSFSSLRIG